MNFYVICLNKDGIWKYLNGFQNGEVVNILDKLKTFEDFMDAVDKLWNAHPDGCREFVCENSPCENNINDIPCNIPDHNHNVDDNFQIKIIAKKKGGVL